MLGDDPRRFSRSTPDYHQRARTGAQRARRRRTTGPQFSASETETRTSMEKLTEADVASLVDTGIIQAATNRLTKAVARLKQAELDDDTAAASCEAATAASVRAVAGGGDAMAAELALEGAARTLSVAGNVLEAAKKERQAAHENINPARKLAWRPVYVEGIRRRLQSTKAAD